MSQSNMKLRLSVMENGQPVRVEELASDMVPIKVGRLSSSHLRFDDSSVSRIHAVIEAAADGSFNLIDLGSAAGTFVNGEKITKASIKHGDNLQFGNIVVMLTLVDELPQETMPSMSSLDFKEEATVISVAPSEPVAPQPVAVAPVAQPAPVAPSLSSLASPTANLPWSAPQPQQPAAVAAPQHVEPVAPQPVAQPAPAVQVAPQAQVQPQQPQVSYAAQPVAPAAASVNVSAGYNASTQTVTTPEGVQVEPFTLQGYYDEHGNYIPGFYDEQGQYHYGYGYYDDQGQWQVAQGYYDPQGEWVDHPLDGPAGDQPFGPPDIDYYTEAFFQDAGGDTLEVAMIWNDQVISVNSYSKPRSVIIGADPKSDFFFEDPALTQDPFPIVTYDGSGYAVIATEGMTGLIQNGQQQYSLQEAIAQGIARKSGEVSGGYAIPLSSRTSVRLDVGEANFLMHFTDQPVLVGVGMGVDFSTLPYYALSIAAHAAFLILALTNPEDPSGLELDGIQTDNRFVQLMVTPEQEEEVKPDWLGAGDDAQEEAAKHKGEEGQAGKEDSDQTNKQMAIKGPTDNKELQLKRAADTAVAMDAGALAVLGDQVASPFGNASESIGSDAIHALGNLEGDGTGESRGFGGLGLAGAGRGGGGISERGLGMGNVETAGRGGGGRGGSDYGRGASDLGEKKARVPVIVPGKPEIRGSLDKEIIARVVRQHRNEIRYCYEKELQKNPKLSGQVKVKFTISGTGRVISAIVNGSTVKNASVENCVADKIRRWVFPEPKGGGIVIVNYPFNFSS